MRPLGKDGGSSLVELLVVASIVAIIAVPSVVFFLGFLQSQEVNGATQQVATLLNEARQLAITSNTSYRVEVDAANNRVRFVRTSNGSSWKGPGTDRDGYVVLENQARVMGVTAAPVFNALGTASGGTITVRSARGGGCRDVVVAATGRVRQAARPSCP
jgi:Tfp pilus assembly protein FimT